MNLEHKTTRISSLLVLAGWFGILTGAVEGIGSLVIQRFQWHSWNLYIAPTPENVWICPLVDVFLAVVMAVGVFVIAKIFPRVPALRLLVFLLTTMLLFDWFTFGGFVRGKEAYAAISFLASFGGTRAVHWFRRHESAAVRFWTKTLPGLAVVTTLTIIAIGVGSWWVEQHAISSLPPVSSSKPLNVLVVIIDTLRADHLSGYGYARPTSPNLDELARNGVLFENAFAASSWTLPSHASMLTGRYVREHRAGRKPLDGRWPTIAEVMRSQGYVTAALSANTYYFSRRVGLGRGFIHFEDFSYSISDLIMRTSYGVLLITLFRRLGLTGYIVRRDASSINLAALRWIDSHRDRPFFVFLNYFDVHDPYEPPPAYRTKFSRSGRQVPLIDIARFGSVWPSLTQEELRDEVDGYDAAIAYADSQLGELLAEMKKRGLADNTLIVVTGDHGESFGEHGLLHHGNALYLDTIRVPLVITGPADRVPQGVRVQAPVSNIALPATLMDLLGLSNNIFPHESLRRVWEERASVADRMRCAESELDQNTGEPPSPARSGWLKSIETPQWHFILHEKLGPELYDWRNDPEESNNRIGTTQAQAVSGDLRARLDSGCQ